MRRRSGGTCFSPRIKASAHSSIRIAGPQELHLLTLVG